MDGNKELECVKWVKNLAVKHQKYEAAANLRDREISLSKSLRIKHYVVSYEIDQVLLDNFDIDQLRFVQDLLEKYFSLEESVLITEIIQLRRHNKIDNLLD